MSEEKISTTHNLDRLACTISTISQAKNSETLIWEITCGYNADGKKVGLAGRIVKCCFK